ncbi:MAG TPA: SRPBCC family protein [Stellaceae bacterium]
MSRTIAPAPVRKHVEVGAPRDRAFAFFTARMGRWWRADHSLLAGKARADVVVEPHLGGRWFERAVDGSECDWGKVLEWEPPDRVVLAWQLNADWRYDPDLITELEIRFVALGAARTRVELEHRKLENFGARAEEVRAALDSYNAWQGGLDRFAEIADREA